MLTLQQADRAGPDRGQKRVLLPPLSALTSPSPGNVLGVCRNITTLRGLEPAASPEEIEAAARQYVRKVSGVRVPSGGAEPVFEAAIRRVTEATADLLAQLPPRRQPPPTLPPLRRLERQRI
jgi:hypothetical protein